MSEAAGLSHVLRLAVGPVQGFIVPGRRTRDLWAGSFLLSLLSGAAMRAVIRASTPGRIDLPAVQAEDETITEETLRALDNAPLDTFDVENPPRGPIVGTLVNHFRAEVPEGFKPEICR